MNKIEDIVEELEQYVYSFKGDLFSVSILNSLQDYKRYLIEKKKKEEKIQRLQDEKKEEIESFSGMVSEPIEKHITISLDRIIDYSQTLTETNDVKTIQLMLFELIGTQCNEEQYQKICNIGKGVGQQRKGFISANSVTINGNPTIDKYYEK